MSVKYRLRVVLWKQLFQFRDVSVVFHASFIFSPSQTKYRFLNINICFKDLFFPIYHFPLATWITVSSKIHAFSLYSISVCLQDSWETSRWFLKWFLACGKHFILKTGKTLGSTTLNLRIKYMGLKHEAGRGIWASMGQEVFWTLNLGEQGKMCLSFLISPFTAC